MKTEIEAKLKVDSLEIVERQLQTLGAQFVEQQRQIDYYFDDEKSSFAKNDKCLRLRLQSAENKKIAFLTYKGPKQKDEFKKRLEIEIQVSEVASAENLLSALGYSRKLVIEKERKIWQLCSCFVALDNLPSLGCFVEIEGPDNSKIAEVRKKLGLENIRHIPESYAELMTKNTKSSLKAK
jgi:adenylate cyclase class 2